MNFKDFIFRIIRTLLIFLLILVAISNLNFKKNKNVNTSTISNFQTFKK